MRLLKGWCIWYLCLVCFDLSAQDIVCAIPPAPNPITVIQPDGSYLKIQPKGGPFLHWTETTDGYTVVKNTQGYYEYAVKESGKLKPSGIRVADSNGSRARSTPPNVEKHLKPDAETSPQRLPMLPGHQTLLNQNQAGMPSTGNQKVLCILIEYPNLKKTFSKENFNKLMNGPMTGGQLSFAEFYAKSSFGKLNLSVDVVGWYQAKSNYATYGDGGSKSASDLVTEAVEAADKDGVDFTKYDNNKDGVVDGIIIVHAGPGGEEGLSSQYIWSHMSYVSTTADGVYVRPYCINPEVRNGGYGNNGMVGVGVFAHEFGHLLGLPDLYDTNGGGEGIGEWGLMGNGNWLGMENFPAGFSAWSKEKLGWIVPKDITEDFQTFTLKAASESPEAYKIKTANPNEYFLIENRQQVGIDGSLSGHGLAIWHINTKKTNLYPASNTVNINPENKGVDLEEADGRNDLDNGWNRSDETDLYPADYYEITSFDYSSNPNSNLTEKVGSTAVTGISISNIKETNKTVQFTYRRDIPDIGEDCGNPATAIVGKNHTPQLNYFFEYTMPKDGTLYLSVDDPGLYVGGTIYQNCEEANQGGGGTPVYLDGSSSTGQVFKLDYVKKGTKMLIHWEYNLNSDLGQEEGFDWNLSIETGGVASQDSLALVAMYQKMGGKDWYYKQNWLKNNVSSWEGITVSKGRVTGLQLYDLQNSVPNEFYQLSALEILSLQSTDSLTGTLDDRITAFKQLKHITINTRGLVIDFIDKLDGSLPALKSIELNAYQLNGEIPSNVGALSQLEILTLRGLKFKSKIPESLGTLSKLTSLTLSGGLYGTIPESLGSADGLQFIDLSFNALTGKIPASFDGMSNLEYLNVQYNQLSGSIPAGLFKLPHLASFYADHNQFESVPENFFSSASLEYIEVSHNKIKGSLPHSVSGDQWYEIYVYLNNNQLSGKVPDELSNVPFAVLDLSHNLLDGQLPKISFTESLNISYNHFTGLPKLTQSSDEYYKQLYCQHNYLSFDDLLPNMSILLCSECGFEGDEDFDQYQQFKPQDSLDLKRVQAVAAGSSHTIDLAIDEKLTTNEYRWYLSDKLLTTTKTGKLKIENFSAEKAGAYRCEVFNSELNNFALYYDGIELRLNDKKAQTITIATVSNKTYGNPPFKLGAQSTGLPQIAYEVVEGPVTLSGDTVKIEGTGKVKIRAYNVGNDEYNPTEAFVEFMIAKASQQISYEPPVNVTYGTDKFKLAIQTSSQLPIDLELVKGKVELTGPWVTVQGAGMVEIIARQEGGQNYLPADPVNITFEVAKANQEITLADIEDKIYGAPPVEMEPSSTQGLAVKLEALTDNISIEGNVISFLKAGQASVRASQPGDANIKAAVPVVKNFTIHKATQVLYFQQIEDKMLTDEPFELQAYSNQGLPVSYEIIKGEAFIEIQGNLVNILGAGSVQIQATQAGDENYEPAEPMQRGFTILDASKAYQTLSVLAEIPDTVQINQTYEFQVEATSGLPPAITIEGPASLVDGQLTFLSPGKVQVIIEQNGNDAYNAAPIIVKEYYVTEKQKAQQTITFTPIGNKVFGDEPFTVDFQASSGLPVSVSIAGPAQIDGNTITLTGAGTVQITYYQVGNEDFLAVEEQTFTFEVAKASQVIDLTVAVANDTAYVLAGSSSAGLPVSYQVIAGEGMIRNDTLYASQDGEVTIQATQEGNENYLPAEPVTRVVEVKIVTGAEDPVVRLMKIYPNPSESIFQLEWPDKRQAAWVEVHNVDGKTVWKQLWNGNTTKIDLSGMAQGVYHVRFTYEGKWHSKPIIIKW